MDKTFGNRANYRDTWEQEEGMTERAFKKTFIKKKWMGPEGG